jgi:HlyD family secretion protein
VPSAKRAIQVLVTVAALGGLGTGGYFAYQAYSKPAEITYRTTKIDRGNVVGRVTATGTLSAHVTVLVGCQVSGRIAQLFADFNSKVKKGQVVAKIDPAIFEAQVASMRANRFAAEGALAQARAQAKLAQANLTRAQALRAEGLNSQADLDNAQAALEVALAQVEAQKGSLEQARAQQNQAEVNLAYTTIVSPIDGTVISRGVDVGQTVAASLQAPTLFTIAEDLHKMQVDTNVTEGDVGKLRDGMAATFLVDAYPNERFRGTIQMVRNAPQTVQNVVTYDAVIDVDNTDLKLKPGMTANVTIVFERREDVLRVPNAALRFRPPPALTSAYPTAVASAPRWGGGQGAPASSGSAGRRRNRPDGGAGKPGDGKPGDGKPGAEPDAVPSRTLWVLRDGKPVPIPVKVGLSDGTLTEILSGDVNDGDLAVVEAQTEDGAPVGTAKPQGGGQAPRMRL